MGPLDRVCLTPDSNGTLRDLVSWDRLTCDPSLREYRYFGALLGLVVTVVGSAGNLMTLLAFALDPRLRTRFNLLILNLTLSDLLYCAFLQPLTVRTYLAMAWDLGAAACRLSALLVFAANLISILGLVNIAVARYVLVRDPRRFDRVYRGRTLPFFLAGPWVVSLGLLVPYWCVFTFQPTVCTCSFHRTAGRPYTTILHALSFGLGLGCIGAFYLLIHRRMRAASRAVRRHGAGSADPGAGASSCREGTSSSSSPSVHGEAESMTGDGRGDAGGPGASGGVGRLRQATRRWRARRASRSGEAEFRRVTAMCFGMFLVYLGCYLPFCLVHLAEGRVPGVVQTLAGNLTWFNSCLNPLLYAAMNRQFKEGYRTVLRLPCRGSVHSRHSSRT